MEHPDPVFVDVDVVEIIEALEHVVRRIIEHAGPVVVARAFKEHLIGDAVVEVFARMDFVADIDAAIFGVIQYRLPARGEFVEGCLDQTGGALRPRIYVRPRQCA